MQLSDFKNEPLSDFKSNPEAHRKMKEAIEEVGKELGRDYPLVIDGERQLPVPENARAVFNDRSAGKFRRSLRLREGVDVNSIDASLQLGVLTLTLQKTAEAGAKKIAIRSGQ